MEVFEQGTPADDIAAFRRALGQYGTGVAVVTTRSGNELAGMTSNSFTSVSLDPPLVLWSIRRASSSYTLFENCTHFAINILASNQIDLSQKFAKSTADKFDGVNWRAGLGDVPLLEGTIASFECRSVRNHDGGDHLIMIGEVERYSRYNERDALLFVQGRYASSVDHPQTVMAVPSAPGDNDLGLEVESLSSLLVRAYSAISPTLIKAREMEGVSLMEARLMRGIRSFPGRSLTELLPALLLGVNSSEDVLSGLLARNFVRTDGGGLWLTPEGETCFLNVLSHARKLEKDELADLPRNDVATMRNILIGLISRSAKDG